MNDLVLVLFGFGIFAAIAIIAFVISLLIKVNNKLDILFVDIDERLVEFGKSPVGMLLHNSVATLKPYVDQPTDTAVVQVASLAGSIAALAKIAKAAGIEITPENVSKWATKAIEVFSDLTDGEPEAQG